MKISKKRLQEIVLEEMKALGESAFNPNQQQLAGDEMFARMQAEEEPEAIGAGIEDTGLAGGSAVASRLGTNQVQAALEALKKALANTPATARADVVAKVIQQLGGLSDTGGAARIGSALKKTAGEMQRSQADKKKGGV